MLSSWKLIKINLHLLSCSLSLYNIVAVSASLASTITNFLLSRRTLCYFPRSRSPILAVAISAFSSLCSLIRFQLFGSQLGSSTFAPCNVTITNQQFRRHTGQILVDLLIRKPKWQWVMVDKAQNNEGKCDITGMSWGLLNQSARSRQSLGLGAVDMLCSK